MAGAVSVAAVALASVGPAQAALVDRGGGLVYDSDRNLTWLADPALLPGPMAHLDAAQFAAGFEYAGGSDWLLPQAAFIDSGCAGAEGFGCIDSDMGHLFHQLLGGSPGTSVFDSSGDTAEEIANVALMPALAESWFWSWQIADDGATTAFAFNFGNGLQHIRDVELSGRLLLVHSGDLGAAATVDSPPTLPLVLAAAALALLARPKRRRKS
jgi:hypothetical protein